MSTLREKNQKILEKHMVECDDVKKVRNQMVRQYGVDPVTDTKQFPFAEGGVDLKKLQYKLEEADSSSAFTQFLRAGLQQAVMNMYKATETTWQDWATVIASNKDTEIYAPNHGVAFPKEVGQGEVYPEVSAAALDLELKNKKFGSMYALSYELAEDDQTGSFMQQSSLLGEYCALVQEAYAYGKLASVASMKYLDLVIPTSETKPSYESAYPWSTSLRGGGATKGTFGALIQANVQAGIIGLMNQKNLQGIKMVVNPKRLLIGPYLKFDAGVLLNSAYYPSGAATAGAIGGAFAVNMLKGILDLTVSRFMFKNDGTVNGDSKAWYIVDDTKPFFVMQQRTPVSVVQENPGSGAHFNQDIIRFKSMTRFNCDFTDPRFSWIGNDSSV